MLRPVESSKACRAVAISQARDHAELVTADAGKLSEQLKRATGKRVAALDGVARERAHEAVLGSEPSENREVRRAGRMDREHDTDLQPERVHEPGHLPWHVTCSLRRNPLLDRVDSWTAIEKEENFPDLQTSGSSLLGFPHLLKAHLSLDKAAC